MGLYQEIIFLKTFYKGKYLVENVKPYYTPLIPAIKRGRHLYWCNFNLPNKLSKRLAPSMKAHGDRPANNWRAFAEFHKIDLTNYKGKQSKGKMARNLVDYEAGRTILETVLGIEKKQNVNQISIFDAI